MRRFKIISALLVLALVGALVPRPAYAYVDYSGDEAFSRYGAAYEYLRTHGGDGLPSTVDTNASAFLDQLGFAGSVISAPSSPFVLFAINYVVFVPFVGWRVLEASDISNSDSREAYEHLLDESVDFLNSEWEAWKEEYPAAGGGTPVVLPDGFDDYFVVEYADSISVPTSNTGTVYTFSDGFELILSKSDALAFNNFSSALSYAQPYDSTHVTGRTQASNASVVPLLRNWHLARSLGLSDGNYYGVGFYSTSSFVYYNSFSSSGNGAYAPAVDYVTSGSYAPVPCYVSSSFDRGTWAKYHVVIKGSGFFVYGTDAGSGDGSDGPTGPTAPDYTAPEPVDPAQPSQPTVTNPVGDTTTIYTGNETDYSDYLKIIIDNQNTQIGQISDFSDFFGGHMQALTAWLEAWFINFSTYFDNSQAYLGNIVEWLHSISDMLYGVGDTLRGFRSDFSTFSVELFGWLQAILEKIPEASGGGGVVVFPVVPIDPEDATGFFDWLYGILDQILSVLVGNTARVSECARDLARLRRVFPFSLPWDLVSIVSLLAHDPVDDYTLMVPILDSATEGGSVGWSYQPADLSPFAGAISFVRYGFLGAVAIGLIFKTRDMLNGLMEVMLRD